MAVHDAWARFTPYELSFPDLERARAGFEAVAEEARDRKVDRGDPALFVLLGSVGHMLQEIRPDQDDPEHIHLHGLLLYHAFHFWEAGEQLFLMKSPLVRRLAGGPLAREWKGELAAPAGYLQLPQHLLWTGGEDGSPPESVDGFYWTAPTPGSEIGVLLAAGMRGDRPGLSVLPLPPLPVDQAVRWQQSPVHEGGSAFQSSLPGAELEGLLQIGTPGEGLELVARALACLMEGTDVGERERAPVVEGPPRPTQLPYRMVAGR